MLKLNIVVPKNVPLAVPENLRHSLGGRRIENMKHDEEDLSMAAYLFQQIRKNDKVFKEPNLEYWAHDIHQLKTKDKRTLEEIKEVIDFCSADPFWCSVILSGRKLREKFSTLRIRMTQIESRNKLSFGKPSIGRPTYKEFDNENNSTNVNEGEW